MKSSFFLGLIGFKEMDCSRWKNRGTEIHGMLSLYWLLFIKHHTKKAYNDSKAKTG